MWEKIKDLLKKNKEKIIDAVVKALSKILGK